MSSKYSAKNRPNTRTILKITHAKDLINDLNLMGLIFENLCIRDLRVYADVLDGDVYHYRDKTDSSAMQLFISEVGNMD